MKTRATDHITLRMLLLTTATLYRRRKHQCTMGTSMRSTFD